MFVVCKGEINPQTIFANRWANRNIVRSQQHVVYPSQYVLFAVLCCHFFFCFSENAYCQRARIVKVMAHTLKRTVCARAHSRYNLHSLGWVIFLADCATWRRHILALVFNYTPVFTEFMSAPPPALRELIQTALNYRELLLRLSRLLLLLQWYLQQWHKGYKTTNVVVGLVRIERRFLTFLRMD